MKMISKSLFNVRILIIWLHYRNVGIRIRLFKSDRISTQQFRNDKQWNKVDTLKLYWIKCLVLSNVYCTQTSAWSHAHYCCVEYYWG